MVLPWIILLVIGPTKCFILNNDTKAPEVYNRIYRGYDAYIHQYSYAVFLNFESTTPSSCGGSLILVQTVLTAAHCVDELRYKRGEMHAFFGATTPKNSKITRQVVDYRINPKYNEQNGNNNLAVAFLKSSVPLQHEIKKIPFVKSDPPANFILYSVGWGKQKVGGQYNKLPDISSWRPMKATKQRVLSISECTEYLGSRIPPSLLCSAPEIGHFYKDDSGNGLVTQAQLLAGVLSFVANGVSFFTSVDAHRKWIGDASYSLYISNCGKKR